MSWRENYEQQVDVLLSKYRNLLRPEGLYRWDLPSGLLQILQRPIVIFGVGEPRTIQDAATRLARGLSVLRSAQERNPCDLWRWCEHGSAGAEQICIQAIVDPTHSEETVPGTFLSNYKRQCGLPRSYLTGEPARLGAFGNLGQTAIIPVSSSDKAEADRRLGRMNTLVVVGIGIGLMALATYIKSR